MADEEEDSKQFTDAAGRPQLVATGPRGQRMAQLGILTQAQKKKPKMPEIRTNAEGQPHPGDVENAKFQSTLAQQAQDQKMRALQTGPQNTLSEADPMKTSLYRRPQINRR
jgi:hypothetical protein